MQVNNYSLTKFVAVIYLKIIEFAEFVDQKFIKLDLITANHVPIRRGFVLCVERKCLTRRAIDKAQLKSNECSII